KEQLRGCLSSPFIDAFGPSRGRPGTPGEQIGISDLSDLLRGQGGGRAIGGPGLATGGADYARAVSDSSLAEVLRSRGLRMTPQRQLVLDAVRQLGHATPEQVHAGVRRVADSVNITTVYRTLELLEDLGLVTHTHLSHGAPTYHPVEESPHIHL